MENILAPSILSADFKILGEQIEQTEKAGAKYIHFDVMDGIFVPSISFGPGLQQAFADGTMDKGDLVRKIQELGWKVME